MQIFLYFYGSPYREFTGNHYCLPPDHVFLLLMSFYLPGSDLCTRSFRSNTSGMLGMTSELFFVSSSSVGEGRGEGPKDIFQIKNVLCYLKNPALTVSIRKTEVVSALIVSNALKNNYSSSTFPRIQTKLTFITRTSNLSFIMYYTTDCVHHLLCWIYNVYLIALYVETGPKGYNCTLYFCHFHKDQDMA